MIFAFMISRSEAKPSYFNINFNVFYSELSPYGEWIEIDYDVYAWRPYNTSYNWQPYTIGGWVWTSQGWFWDSYEPFGWATYHYGRWYYDDFYGWLWMPGYDWAPAWVEWRYNASYIGWAPLPPYAVYRNGIGIHFSVNWYSPYKHWRFVTYNHFHYGHVHNYFVPVRETQYVFSTTKYRTNYYSRGNGIFNGGVERKYVESRSGQKIRERNLQVVSDPRNLNSGGNRGNETIRVYRPSSDDINQSRSIDRSKIKSADSRSSIVRDSEIKKMGRSINRSDAVRDRNSSSAAQRNNISADGRSKVERNDRIQTERNNNSIRNKSNTSSERNLNSNRNYNYHKPKTSTRENSYKLKDQNRNNNSRSYSPKVERKTVVTPNGKISRRERSVTPNTGSNSRSKVEVRNKSSRTEIKSSRNSGSSSSSRTERSNSSKSKKR